MGNQQDAGPERGADAPLPDSPDEAAPARRPAQSDAGMALVAPKPTAMVAQEAGAMALTAQIEANVKAKHYLAKAYPRSWEDVRLRLLKAFERPVLAEGAIYSKPIGGKDVEGLSIRFAEEAFRTMGNIVVETLLVSDDEDKRVYIVTGMDLETNASLPVPVVVTKQIERSSAKHDAVIIATRTNSRGGKVYILKATSEDDYRSKEAAQLQKARRDVILFLTPGDIKEECEQQIRATTRDRDAKDPKAAINRMTEAFFSFSITPAEVEKYLGHPVATTNTGELQRLRKILTSLKDGETTWADVMEAKLNTNTGADTKVGDSVESTKGAAAKLGDAVKGKAPAPAPGIPENIQKLIDNEQVPEAFSDEDHEELRQYRADHPDLFNTKGKK